MSKELKILPWVHENKFESTHRRESFIYSLKSYSTKDTQSKRTTFLPYFVDSCWRNFYYRRETRMFVKNE